MKSRVRGLARSGGRLRALAGYLALVLVMAPLVGCSYFNKSDDYVPDDPADKLYNQGLVLLNRKQDYKEAAKKFDEKTLELTDQGVQDIVKQQLAAFAKFIARVKV